MDGDGPDFAFGGRDGYLYCIRDDGKAAKLLWKLSLGAPIASVLLAHLDGDGRSDIAASAGDGNIYVLRE